jgi:hypothetical protein
VALASGGRGTAGSTQRAVQRSRDHGGSKWRLTRFESPRALMKFLGLIPSEYPSAEQRRQGSMTQAGTTHARWALVEGAWAYRSPAKVSRHLPWRREKQPPIIQDIRWKAQVRLCKRDRQRIARGTHANVGTVAMTRALVRCMWALAQDLPVTPYAQKTEPPCTLNAAGFLRASAEAQPRCGVTLDGVQRLVQDTRVAREAGTRRMPGRWEPTHG